MRTRPSGEHRLYARISALGLLILGYLIAASSIDTWTVVRFAGSRGLPAAATAWHDAVFQKPLSFYLFDLPFYLMLRGYVLAIVIFCILVYWIAARGWQLRYQFPAMRESGQIDPTFFRLEGGLESRFLRGAARGAAAGHGACASSWRATKWSTTSTARSWWASTTWIRTSACRCNGC